jgi:hypothetical protein
VYTLYTGWGITVEDGLFLSGPLQKVSVHVKEVVTRYFILSSLIANPIATRQHANFYTFVSPKIAN